MPKICITKGASQPQCKHKTETNKRFCYMTTRHYSHHTCLHWDVGATASRLAFLTVTPWLHCHSNSNQQICVSCTCSLLCREMQSIDSSILILTLHSVWGLHLCTEPALPLLQHFILFSPLCTSAIPSCIRWISKFQKLSNTACYFVSCSTISVRPFAAEIRATAPDKAGEPWVYDMNEAAWSMNSRTRVSFKSAHAS